MPWGYDKKTVRPPQWHHAAAVMAPQCWRKSVASQGHHMVVVRWPCDVQKVIDVFTHFWEPRNRTTPIRWLRDCRAIFNTSYGHLTDTATSMWGGHTICYIPYGGRALALRSPKDFLGIKDWVKSTCCPRGHHKGNERLMYSDITLLPAALQCCGCWKSLVSSFKNRQTCDDLAVSKTREVAVTIA